MVDVAPTLFATHRHRQPEVPAVLDVAFTAIASGRWPEAWAATDNCLALLQDDDQPETLALVRATAGVVAAVRGDTVAAVDALASSERTAHRRGLTDVLDVIQLGRAVEALGGGRYEEAWVRLRPIVNIGPDSGSWLITSAVGFLAEAAFRCGDRATREALRAVEEIDAFPSGLAREATTFARSLLSLDLARDAQFEAALSRCPSDRPFDRARLQLMHGVCLRRDRRVTECRLPLHEALVSFERLGANPWADQARQELRATGAQRTSRSRGDVETLTAQELQIIRLAASGLTNRQIGQRLYLSHRTVGSHLYRAFPKLGISARSQLRDVVDELDGLQRPMGAEGAG